MKRIGKTPATLLIHGESGTGKELIADAIHAASDRASGPLIKVNCAALVESLLLSELFGHEKGAFTGARRAAEAASSAPSGGTLFLDEIGDISPRTQVALLRVLEERKIERVGGSDADPRRRAHRLRHAPRSARDGRTRRVSRGSLLPPERDHPARAASTRTRRATFRCSAKRCSSGSPPNAPSASRLLSEDALELLMRHRWPGNVRELENVLRAVSLFAASETIEQKDFRARRGPAQARHGARDARQPRTESPGRRPARPEELPAPHDSALARCTGVRGRVPRDPRSRRQPERAQAAHRARVHLSRVAGRRGNITRAAAMLGMKRPRLSQLVKQYGLLPGEERER